MGKKSKQRKNQPYHAGGGSAGPLGHALQRLPTTVKADAPTLVLGRAATPAKAAFGNPLSRFTRRLAQARRAPAAAWNDMRTVHKMKKLAHQMAKGTPSMSKKRRSRLPLVVALLALVVCAGGYYAYRNVRLPHVHVTRYLNPHKWLDSASGHKPVHVVHHTTRHVSSYAATHAPRRHSRVSSTHRRSAHVIRSAKSTKHHSRSTKVAKHKKSRGHSAKLAKRKKHHRYRQTSYGR